MKKKEKTVCQIIRFRGKIEAFFVSIDEFAISSNLNFTGRTNTVLTMVTQTEMGQQLSQTVMYSMKVV